MTRTIELSNQLRTSAGSHERFLVIEVFGRYAGFSALLPAMAGACNRCLIPEYFDHQKPSMRALREGYRVLGIRKGWEGMIRIDRDRPVEDQDYCQLLTGQMVNKVGRTGGTFLHTSR